MILWIKIERNYTGPVAKGQTDTRPKLQALGAHNAGNVENVQKCNGKNVKLQAVAISSYCELTEIFILFFVFR